MIPVPFAHQTTTSNFMADHPACYIGNDPGTGKTRSVIDALEKIRIGKTLVLAPLTILQPSWGDDIAKFAPEARYGIAHGSKREDVLKRDLHYAITNHDAVNWLEKVPKDIWRQYSHLVIDESTVFKNRTAQRSKALKKLAANFETVTMMSGSGAPNGVCDLWHQYFVLDNGERLGRDFYRFQNMMCIGEQQFHGGQRFTKWRDRDDAMELVADMVKDITIRFKFEDCIDIPENTQNTYHLEMPGWLRTQYNELMREGMLLLQDGIVSSPHAAAKMNKVLQLLSGALYTESGTISRVHEERYQFVMELVAQRQQSLVAFNWKHELAALVDLATKMKIPFGVINGGVSRQEREEVVAKFQAGELQVIFAHPQSASHGLTLTKGTATIWCSPTHNAEWWKQFNQRIYRAGQTQKTETIRVAYADSRETEVYDMLDGKLGRLDLLLTLFTDITKLRQAV